MIEWSLWSFKILHSAMDNNDKKTSYIALQLESDQIVVIQVVASYQQNQLIGSLNSFEGPGKS